jgi:hypothetical protein
MAGNFGGDMARAQLRRGGVFFRSSVYQTFRSPTYDRDYSHVFNMADIDDELNAAGKELDKASCL